MRPSRKEEDERRMKEEEGRDGWPMATSDIEQTSLQYQSMRRGDICGSLKVEVRLRLTISRSSPVHYVVPRGFPSTS